MAQVSALCSVGAILNGAGCPTQRGFRCVGRWKSSHKTLRASGPSLRRSAPTSRVSPRGRDSSFITPIGDSHHRFCNRSPATIFTNLGKGVGVSAASDVTSLDPTDPCLAIFDNLRRLAGVSEAKFRADVTPYSGRFCEPNPPFGVGLRCIRRDFSEKMGAKSLFGEILRVSLCGSRFCVTSAQSRSGKFRNSNILRKSRGGGYRYQLVNNENTQV